MSSDLCEKQILVGLDLLLMLDLLEIPLLLFEQPPALKLFLFEECLLLLTEVFLEVDCEDGPAFKDSNECPMGNRGNPNSSSVTAPGIQNSQCQDCGSLFR